MLGGVQVRLLRREVGGAAGPGGGGGTNDGPVSGLQVTITSPEIVKISANYKQRRSTSSGSVTAFSLNLGGFFFLLYV